MFSTFEQTSNGSCKSVTFTFSCYTTTNSSSIQNDSVLIRILMLTDDNWLTRWTKMCGTCNTFTDDSPVSLQMTHFDLYSRYLLKLFAFTGIETRGDSKLPHLVQTLTWNKKYNDMKEGSLEYSNYLLPTMVHNNNPILIK